MKQFYKTFINSPYLFLYKAQYASIFSILLRISGFILFILFLSIFLNLNNIFFNFNVFIFIFELCYAFGNVFNYIIIISILYFLVYHILVGSKYIFSINILKYKDLAPFINRYYYYTIGFILLLLILIIIIIISILL